MCPGCGNHNYARRHACNKCQTMKPGMMSGLGAGPTAAQLSMAQMAAVTAMLGAAAGAPLAIPTTGGGKNFRPGDWSCTACGNHNFASRATCNKCGGAKLAVPTSAYGKAAVGPTSRYSPYTAAVPFLAAAPVPTVAAGGKGMKAGDWICPGCSNLNFASRDKCNKCQRAKNLPGNFRDGDWLCPKCTNHNFASKVACNKCGEAKVLTV